MPRACTCRRPARRPARSPAHSDRVVARRRTLRPVRAVSGPRAENERPTKSSRSSKSSKRERNPPARTRTPSQERPHGDVERGSFPRTKTTPHERKKTTRTKTTRTKTTQTESELLFYTPRMQISGSQKPGGRSHARPLVGRKGGREPPWIQTFAYTVQPFP